MAERVPVEHRIYCICGQKMKVSEAMFGLPGKCVACRQKIRIPKQDEWPSGSAQIYLKDHPEFLRKSRRNGAPKPQAPAQPAEEPEVSLGETPERGTVAVLDILEPLRVVCSLEFKIQRRLSGLKDPAAQPGEDADKAALAGYLDRVRAARQDIDEQLRQRLMETAVELAGTNEKVVQAGLSARLGELDLQTFRETVDQLRRRRDALCRFEDNLRGWLAVSDPHQAGGYANVSLDMIPQEGFRIAMPADDVDPRPLLDQHIDGLREGLARRERADRRIEETRRLEKEGTMSALALADCRADCEAEKARAEAEVRFRRRRLEALKADAVADILTLDAHRETMRERVRVGRLEPRQFAALENDIGRAQRDARKMDDWATRALAASNAGDVPHPHGTFLKRMVQGKGSPNAGGRTPLADSGADAWAAWASAILFGLAVFLPLVNNQSPLEAFRLGKGEAGSWVLGLPLIVGVAAAVSQFIRPAVLRGLLLLGVWMAGTFIGAWHIHEAQYAATHLADKFRQGNSLFLRPGFLVLLLADVGLLGAALLALHPVKRCRPWAAVAVLLAGTALVALFTDLGGYWQPKPALDARSVQRFEGEKLYYETSLTVRNNGARRLLVNASASTGPALYALTLERKEQAQWVRDNSQPVIRFGSGMPPVTGWVGTGTEVPAHDTIVCQYRLQPGEYRIQLGCSIKNKPPLTQSLSLAAPPPVKAPEELPPPTPAAKAEPPTVPPVEASAKPAEPDKKEESAAVVPVEAELRGVIAPAGKPPRFSLALHFPDGIVRTLDLMLGDTVYATWTLSEYNSSRQTVTLANADDERILILSRGQRIALQ